jgi:hypothetical protein
MNKKIASLMAGLATILAAVGIMLMVGNGPASASTSAPARSCTAGWLDHAGPVTVGNAGFGWVEMVSNPCHRWWWGRMKCSWIRNGAITYWHSGVHLNTARSEKVGCKAGYQPVKMGINVRKANGTLTWQVLWVI